MQYTRVVGMYEPLFWFTWTLRQHSTQRNCAQTSEQERQEFLDDTLSLPFSSFVQFTMTDLESNSQVNAKQGCRSSGMHSCDQV